MASKPILWFLCICVCSLSTVSGYVPGEGHYQSEKQCRPGEVLNSMPSEPSKMRSIDYLGTGTSSEDYHMSKCCQMGPERCQFVWVFEGEFYAVSCDDNSQYACEPSPTSQGVSSIYLKIERDPISSSNSKGGSMNHLPKLNTPDISNDEGNGHNFPAPFIFPPTTPSSPDVPPMANAGSDVTIRIPENSVMLHGEGSHDDKDITFYLWEFVSGYDVTGRKIDPPTLIDRTLPVLHVINLIPGDYSFILTVSDSANQKNTDTVQLHVLPTEVIDRVLPPGSTSEAPTDKDLETPGDKDLETPGNKLPHPPTNSETDSRPSNSTNPPKERLSNSSGSSGATNSSGVAVESKEKDLYTKRHNLLKVVVPVLLCVCIILILSAVLVGTGFCLCRNKRRMKHLYRYKRLPETIEKT